MTVSDSAQPVPPVLSLRALGGIFLCFLLCFLIISAALPVLFQSWAQTFPSIMALAGPSGDPQLAASGIGGLLKPWWVFAILLLGLKVHFPNESLRTILPRYGFGPRPKLMILMGSLGIGIVVVQLFTKVLIPELEDGQALIPHPANKLNALPQWFLLLIAMNMFTLVPIAEEFLFRGVLYTGLAAIWNRPLAMISTSAMFIALHPGNLSSGSTLTHLGMVVITVLMVVAREKTGALYVPIMLHAGFNFSSVVIN